MYHRDFAAKLKRERIFKATDFGWQLGMKFDLLYAERALEELNIASTPAVDPFDPKLQAKIQYKKTDIGFEVLQYTQEYGFEYLGNQ